MNSEYFVEAVRRVVLDAAVSGTISNFKKLPGRAPSPRLVGLANWYAELSPTDKIKLEEALEESAHAAAFGLFCVIDGVRAIEGASEKGSFELTYTTSSGERIPIGGTDAGFLHDHLNAT